MIGLWCCVRISGGWNPHSSQVPAVDEWLLKESPFISCFLPYSTFYGVLRLVCLEGRVGIFKGSPETKVSLFMDAVLSAGALLGDGHSRSRQVRHQFSESWAVLSKLFFIIF